MEVKITKVDSDNKVVVMIDSMRTNYINDECLSKEIKSKISIEMHKLLQNKLVHSTVFTIKT